MSRDRDNNFGGGQGGGMPFYGGMPMGMPMQMVIRDTPNQIRQEPPEPPLRVQIALALNSHLTRKQMPQVAVTEHSVETIPGQKLTDEEIGAQATAMNAMSHYLAGKLQPDIWEAQSLQQNDGIPTMEFRCVCKRQDNITNPECPFCAGDGVMDIVIRNPRKAISDGNGNITVAGVLSRTKVTGVETAQTAQTPPPPAGGRPGRRPSGPNESE